MNLPPILYRYLPFVCFATTIVIVAQTDHEFRRSVAEGTRSSSSSVGCARCYPDFTDAELRRWLAGRRSITIVSGYNQMTRSLTCIVDAYANHSLSLTTNATDEQSMLAHLFDTYDTDTYFAVTHLWIDCCRRRLSTCNASRTR